MFSGITANILDYNRVVSDLNGMTSDQFLEALKKNFNVESKGIDNYKPIKLHEFSLYIDGTWYSLVAKDGTFNDSDPIGVLMLTFHHDLFLMIF